MNTASHESAHRKCGVGTNGGPSLVSGAVRCNSGKTRLEMFAMHLIRFANKIEHKRGITALLEVPRVESLGLPDFQMVVTDEHIQALERAKVGFTYLSKTAANAQAPSSLQA